MKIDCGRCEMRGAGCQDCVVTVIGPGDAAGYSAQRPGYLGEAEVKALGVLAAAGLVPPLRFSPPGSTVLAGSAVLPGSAVLASSTVLPGARAWTRRSFPDTKAS
jgi:hypothetical protein